MVSHPLVVYVDSDDERATAVCDFLDDRTPPVSTRRVSSIEEALAVIATEAVDCVLSTQDVADGTGCDLVRELSTTEPDLPVVLSPVEASADLASEAERAGVAAYVPRDETDLAGLATHLDRVLGELAQPGSELHETTRELLLADTTAAVSETAIETAAESLDVEHAAHLAFDQGGATVRSSTASFRELIDGPIAPDTPREQVWFLARDAVETDEPHFVDGTDRTLFPDADPPVTAAMFLPLGTHGVLLFCSTTTERFAQFRKDTALVLASNVEAAFDRLDRRTLLEKRQRQTERLVRFSEEVAHDLRSPLTVARGAVELARTEADFERLDDAERALDRIQTIVDGMLARAKAGVSIDERSAVDLHEVVTAAWDNVDTQAATLVGPPEGATVDADRSRLVEVFENLVRNALEHGGSEVRVTVGVEGDTIWIEDDGPGIEAGESDVFERGFTTAEDGTGYGLAIVEDIVTAHGWAIRVDPEAPGARFEISGVDVD